MMTHHECIALLNSAKAMTGNDGFQKIIDRMEKMEAALMFYADGYYEEGGGVRDITTGTDYGQRAKEALERPQKEVM